MMPISTHPPSSAKSSSIIFPMAAGCSAARPSMSPGICTPSAPRRSLISAVGDDPMVRPFATAMRAWGMDLAGLQTDAAHGTGRVTVSLIDGEPIYDIVPDRAYDHIRHVPADAGGLLYHGTLALRQPVSAATLQALKIGRAGYGLSGCQSAQALVVVRQRTRLAGRCRLGQAQSR